MADEPELEDRVERLETSTGKIESKLDELLGMFKTGGKAQVAAAEHEERKLDRPSAVEEQVRAELARAEQEAKAKADAESEKSERQTIREQLARLTETKPVAPQPRRQKIMWGPR